jgi:ubiquinone/menaquinone biosynthesis C-methylase UbiE
MPVNNSITAFDTIAADYDNSFSHSLTGMSQRVQTRKWLSAFLKDKKRLRILEINCGTGDDAAWLASMGHDVVAADASLEMIREARAKSVLMPADNPVRFLHCPFAELQSGLANEKFDLIFSNFSGLNCVPSNELMLLNEQFYGLLRPGGHMAIVIFGKYTWWETLYYLLKLNPGQAFRRWKRKRALAGLKKGIYQPVYYYSISRFCKLLSRFTLIDKRPVGLFIPPSYMEPLMQKNKRLFRLLEKMEKRSGAAAFSQLSDHCYLLLKAKDLPQRR